MDETISAQDVKEEGLRLFHEGLYEEAADKFRQAKESFKKDGNEVEAAEMANNLGVIHRMRREWDEAITALSEAQEAFANLGDHSREAQTLGNLGGLHASRGEREKAKEYLRQATDKFAELGDAQREGESLMALGVQQWKTGNRGEGLATYQTGLKTLQHPSLGQKALRGLLDLRTKLLSR